MLGLRRWHRWVGIVIAPLLLSQAVTGFMLRAGLGTRLVFGLHTWSLVLKYIAYALATGLAFMAVTGPVMFFILQTQQRRRRLHRAAAPPPPTVGR